ADCVFVAAPAGSDALSPSGGRPIPGPESGVLLNSPIFPHCPTDPSNILAETALIGIEVSDPRYPVFLTLDGRPPIRVKRGSTITIRTAKTTLPLAALPDVSFFNVVRQKLKWSGSNV